VLYREILQVQSSQGPFQRLSELGTVSVTWTPTVPTSLGSPAGFPQRLVKLKLIETPERLAAWLRTRAPEAQGGSDGAAHVD
jgi:hypothetical protein